MQTGDFIFAINVLKAGKPAVFPTDTVYGVGVAVDYADSPREIYDAKGREAGKPIAWLVGGPEALDEYGEDVPEKARRLAERHWPGALTIVVKASDKVPPAFRAEDGTIGLRMPANDTALRLIRVVGPIATSSANLAGEEPPRTSAELSSELMKRVSAVIKDDQQADAQQAGDQQADAQQAGDQQAGDQQADDQQADAQRASDRQAGDQQAAGRQASGQQASGVASTVINCSQEKPVIVRQGTVLEEAVFSVPFEYVSRSKKAMVNARLWTSAEFGGPDDPGAEDPKAVIQIVHGMAEHIDRYDDFARYLVGRGFVVCAEDHVGHGGTATGPDDYGHIPMNGGKNIVVGDVHTLHRMVARVFPGVPYVLYGHSMGSFIARAYIARYGDELSACVLSGTGNVPANMSKMGRSLARFLGSVRGETYRSKLIDGMGAGAYGKKIPNARTDLDWLSTDPAVVDAYIADERCGFMFTVGGYATLLDLTAEVVTLECAAQVPSGLPVLLVAGDGDPVGDMGEGVKAAAQLLRDAGVREVDCKLYEGMRHEIHNEIGKDRVYDDVATWIEAHV